MTNFYVFLLILSVPSREDFFYCNTQEVFQVICIFFLFDFLNFQCVRTLEVTKIWFYGQLKVRNGLDTGYAKKS